MDLARAKTRVNDVKGECIVRRTNIHSNKNIALQLFQSASHFTYNTVVECCLHITKNIEVDVRDICSYTFPFKTAKMFFWKSSACGKNFGGKSFTFTHDLVLKYFVFKYFLVLLALILPNFTSNLFQSKSKKNLHFTKRQAGIYCFENII